MHVLKILFNEKCAHIDFDFYISSRTQNAHMGLNFGLLTLCEYKQTISDIEELWLMKKQDKKYKFTLRQLIHTKWKFDYIIFRKNTENGNNCIQNKLLQCTYS